MVLDEGHKIKNELSQVSIASRKVHASHRVILTGTPLQNNLHELWAMLNYLVPDVSSVCGFACSGYMACFLTVACVCALV